MVLEGVATMSVAGIKSILIWTVLIELILSEVRKSILFSDATVKRMDSIKSFLKGAGYINILWFREPGNQCFSTLIEIIVFELRQHK